MPAATRESASEHVSAPGFEGAYKRLEGGYTVGFERFSEDMDPAELFRGLPDDRCQSPHWGVVVSGRLTFRYADREEVVEQAQAYYAPPGHVPLIAAGTELIEFSPTDALDETFAVISKNLEAADPAP